MPLKTPVLRLGIAGLGAAAGQVIPCLGNVKDQIQFTAVADVRKEALDHYRAAYGVETFDSIEAMAASSCVDAIWIATPNVLHAEHTILVAEHRKHMICEKPMAVTLDQCKVMIEAVERNGVKYVQGHSKIYGTPFKAMKSIIDSGELGEVIQINTWNYNDWMLRPRLASEVDTSQGGGIVFRQGPHQADIVRYLGGGLVKNVKAKVGRHEPAFQTEGDYTAYLEFQDGPAATMSMNGYGFFDSTELTWNIGEGGQVLPEASTRPMKPRPTGPMKPSDKYAAAQHVEADNKGERKQPFFGLTVVSCKKGIIRQSPDGLYVYTQEGRKEMSCPPDIGRAAELLELYDSVRSDRPSFPDARWGMASLELCLAILESSREGREIPLEHQVRGAFMN